MLGSSREALATLRTFVDEQSAKADFADSPSQLLSAASLLSSDKALRVAMSDSGQPVESRVALVRELFGTRLSSTAVEILAQAASLRWSSSDDIVDAIEDMAAQIIFSLAQQVGELDRIENEIFTFSRALETNPDLQMALTNPALPGSAKSAVVRDVLASRAAKGTVTLLEHAAAHLRGRRADVALRTLSNAAAARRNRVVADVRAAIALTPDQSQRLAAALGRLSGREVSLNIVVDPNLIGGVSVRLNDEVIDGSIRTRLEQARRALVG